MGAYPLISLSEARQKRDELRKLLAQNINPTQQRAAEKAARSPAKSFKTVALSWHNSNRTWSENHAARLLASMNNHIFPIIGHLPVTELKTRHFIDLLEGIEKKGLLEVAARTRQHMCNIMRHAVHQELIEHNPAANLDGIIAPPVKRHATNVFCISAIPFVRNLAEYCGLDNEYIKLTSLLHVKADTDTLTLDVLYEIYKKILVDKQHIVLHPETKLAIDLINEEAELVFNA